MAKLFAIIAIVAIMIFGAADAAPAPDSPGVDQALKARIDLLDARVAALEAASEEPVVVPEPPKVVAPAKAAPVRYYYQSNCGPGGCRLGLFGRRR